MICIREIEDGFPVDATHASVRLAQTNHPMLGETG
jgi:hypothetical protein